MIKSLQVVECHPQQRVPCVVFTVENRKYFFNVPESFQRFFRQHSVSFPKGSKIFISQLSIDHMAGLFGWVATISKVADNSQIFGPPGLSSFLMSSHFLLGHSMRPYSVYDFFNNNKKMLGIKNADYLKELGERADYGDIFPRLYEFLTEEQKQKPDIINDAQAFIKEGTYYKDENLEIHPVLLLTEQMEQTSKPSLCYIIKPKKTPGKVLKEKLDACKITGKDIGKFMAAGEIQINGTTYKIEEFKEPDEPSPIVVIVDCPTLHHLRALLTEPKIRSLFADKINEKEEKLKAVVHMIPNNVLLDPLYSEFLKNFSDSCQHIFLNGDIKPPRQVEVEVEDRKENEEKPKKKQGQEASAVDLDQLKYKHFKLTNIFSKYFPQHFPVLSELRSEPKYDLKHLFPFLQNKTTYQKMVALCIAPVKNEGFFSVNIQEKSEKSEKAEKDKKKDKKKEKEEEEKVSQANNFIENEKFKKHYEKWLKVSSEPIKTDSPVQAKFRYCDPELLFLGTQSMAPSTLCNVSGIYLRFWQQGDVGFLLDCGEGSYIQLLNHYGPEKTRQLIKNIGVIYITHVHTDHHLGLLQLIRERDRILEEERIQRDPLFLVLPYNCGVWVSRFSKMIDHLNFRVIFNQHIRIETSQAQPQNVIDKSEIYAAEDINQYISDHDRESKTNIPIFEEFLLKKLGIIRFRSVDVDHCPQAFGVHMEHQDGWCFTYSGDTRPCDSMVKEVEKTTILVHEATFGHDLIDHAIEKKHSTDREAIQIGMRLNAWRTVLTHFSSRYEKTSNTNKPEEQNKVKDDVYYYSKECVVNAADHFGSKFSQLEIMPILSKCMTIMKSNIDIKDE